MTKLRRATIVLVFLVQVLVPTNASGQEGFSSQGGTQVVVDAPIVTITVIIDLVVPDPNAEGIQQTAVQIAQGIMDVWNDGFDQFGNQCLYFNLVVTINPVPESAARDIPIDGGRTNYVTTPGHHVANWGGNGPNAPWPETFDAYDADQFAPPGEDYTTPFAHEMFAVWSGHLETAKDYAHEFGHLLGLGDDYDANGRPLPGREGTLMDNGDLIDQTLVDRLAKIVSDSGKRLPECWKGTYTGTVTFDCEDRPQQTGTLEASFTITVADGVATMDITHTVTGSCLGPNVGTQTGPITATGERTPTGFEFPSFGALFGGSGSLTITVSGDRGTGTILITDLAPGLVMVELAVEISRDRG